MRDLTRFNRNQPSYRSSDDFSRFIDEFLGGTQNSIANIEVPKAEMTEDDKTYSLSLDIPGMKEDDIKINFSQGVLTISGERKYEKQTKDAGERRTEKYYGHFERSFRFVDDVNPEKIEAAYNNGVLDITLEKAPQLHTRSIPVNKKLNQTEPKH